MVTEAQNYKNTLSPLFAKEDSHLEITTTITSTHSVHLTLQTLPSLQPTSNPAVLPTPKHIIAYLLRAQKCFQQSIFSKVYTHVVLLMTINKRRILTRGRGTHVVLRSLITNDFLSLCLPLNCRNKSMTAMFTL